MDSIHSKGDPGGELQVKDNFLNSLSPQSLQPPGLCHRRVSSLWDSDGN
jgi:hypothetical protein